MSRELTVPHIDRRTASWHWSIDRVLPSVNGNHLIGLAIVALAPALFWSAVIKGASLMFGFAIGWFSLSLIATAIFGFLAVIYTCFARSS